MTRTGLAGSLRMSSLPILAATILAVLKTARFILRLISRRGLRIVEAFRLFPHDTAADEPFQRTNSSLLQSSPASKQN